MKKIIVDVLVEVLLNVGIKWIYGIVGDFLNVVLDFIWWLGKIEWIYVCYEEVVVFVVGVDL